MIAYIKLAIILIWILSVASVAQLASWLRCSRIKDKLVVTCFKVTARLSGLRMKIEGRLAKDRPLLLVTNHISYLDILLLGSIGRVSFTPKLEIAGWPIIGWLCKLADCAFIDRNPRRAKENLVGITKRLEENRVLILFPEGTTSDGKQVLPFRSSYFQLASKRFADKPLSIQPAAIRYTHIQNLPIDSTLRHQIAWIGEMELLPHYLNLLRAGSVTVHLVFKSPVALENFNDRKALADHCQEMVAEAHR